MHIVRLQRSPGLPRRLHGGLANCGWVQQIAHRRQTVRSLYQNLRAPRRLQIAVSLVYYTSFTSGQLSDESTLAAA